MRAALLALAFCLALLGRTPTAPTVHAQAPTTAVLVHGFQMGPADMAYWKSQLEAQGLTVYVPQLPSQDNIQNAAYLRDYINTVAPGQKVALIAHSRGGLSSRYYLKVLGGTDHVSTYISIGTPHQGLWLKCLTTDYQICPSSPFMKALNSGDPTPGTLLYTSGYGTVDDDVASTKLPGACWSSVGAVEHYDELTSPAVVAYIESALMGNCP